MKFYSLGIVAANKALNSKVIECTPIEDSPMSDGQLTSQVTTTTTKSQKADGTPYHISINQTNTISATWIPLGDSNRQTAPDVRRGETVMIYRFADQDKYYWQEYSFDLNLRKLETVVHAYSGTQDEGASTTGENSYFTEISTHEGIAHLHTSKANGEPFGYDIQVNAKTGFIQIQDDVGNTFSLNSVNSQLEMINKNGSLVNIQGPNITINAPGTINITAGSAINITSPNTNIN